MFGAILLTNIKVTHSVFEVADILILSSLPRLKAGRLYLLGLLRYPLREVLPRAFQGLERSASRAMLSASSWWNIGMWLFLFGIFFIIHQSG